MNFTGTGPSAISPNVSVTLSQMRLKMHRLVKFSCGNRERLWPHSLGRRLSRTARFSQVDTKALMRFVWDNVDKNPEVGATGGNKLRTSKNQVFHADVRC